MKASTSAAVARRVCIVPYMATEKSVWQMYGKRIKAAEKPCKTNRRKELEMEKRVVDALKLFGVPTHLSGYVYLKDAVVFRMMDGTLGIGEIREQVAMKYGKTVNSVERSMRYVLDRGEFNEAASVEIFGIEDAAYGLITAGEFVFGMAEYCEYQEEGK